MKKYLIIATIVLTGLLIGLGVAYNKERAERHRISNNLDASLSTIETYKTKQNELVSVVSGYEFKLKEFAQLVPDLEKEVKDLKVKLKNVQSVTVVEQVIKYVNKEVIVPVRINDTTKLYSINSEWINANFKITNDNEIRPGDFNIDSIKNKILIVPEIDYKGWWFWRKAIGINVHIKNNNPYVTITGATYIDLRAH